MCKVQWSHHSEEEATWEKEDELMAEFPQLFFPIFLNLEDEILFKGVGFATPKIPSLKNASNKVRI
jgi:hypothetical protein